MLNHGKQKSAVRPMKVEILETKVFIAPNIEEITETIGDKQIEGFQFDLVEYAKDEYIKLMVERDELREEQLTSTQMALVEMYESLGV